MGLFTFIVPENSRFDPQAIDTVFLIGLDQIPWPCTVGRKSSLLTIERSCSDSGKLLLAIRFPEFGEIVVSTATLNEREEPYFLPIELVRGTLSRLNSQLFLWIEGGLDLPDSFSESVDSLNDRMAELVFSQPSAESVEQIIQLLDDIVSIIFHLAKRFADFVLDLRVNHDGAVKSALGFVLAGANDTKNIKLPEWINCVCIPMNQAKLDYNTREFDWAPIEEVQSQLVGQTRLMSYGPMIDFGRRELPDWLNNNETFDLQRQTAANFARGYARTLSKKHQLAFVAAGLNGISARSRSYPQQLQITVDMLEAIENVRTDINTLVSFDQPWGERLGWSVGGTHPMHIADTLLRHGLHISCFGLEVNLDYWPHGSLVRDPLHWVDLIDNWSQFGLPLFVILSAPILNSNNNQAQTAIEDSSLEDERLRKRIRNGMNQQQLYDYLESVIRVLLAKPIVNGIIWRQWQDESNLRFPNSGLVYENGDAKSIQPLLAKVGKLVQGKVE